MLRTPSRRLGKSRLLTASGCALALLAFAADAAEGDASPPANEETPTPEEASSDAARLAKRGGGIEEITVTGRRREERLQSTPLSMVAIPDDELQARQFTDITDVGQAAANVKFDGANGSNSSTRVYIRGVGQDDTRSNVDPGVGIYVDGVYYPRAQGSVISVFDVERIEVLRGPQGMLFGKNTVGGVVQVVTKKPQPDFEGGANLRYGNFGQLETGLSLNVPLVAERAFARFSFNTQTSAARTRSRATETAAC
jgi:iron complex outermembrane receptor protein